MSVGVTIAATVIYFWPTDKYPWAKYVDPSCTLFFSIVVCYTCRKTLGQCLFILMEGAPDVIDGPALRNEIEQIDDGVTVSNFHVWSLSRGKYVMSAHIQCQGEPMKILKQAKNICEEFGIDDYTLQVELPDLTESTDSPKHY